VNHHVRFANDIPGLGRWLLGCCQDDDRVGIIIDSVPDHMALGFGDDDQRSLLDVTAGGRVKDLFVCRSSGM
jgi:hypothetical protein